MFLFIIIYVYWFIIDVKSLEKGAPNTTMDSYTVVWKFISWNIVHFLPVGTSGIFSQLEYRAVAQIITASHLWKRKCFVNKIMR
jgi:hypothetical protein